jgi:hypothetical protein
MRGNAKPRARRAQLPRGVQRDAPDDESRAEIARLTAMGTTQRTPTRESGARRAQRRPKARREPMTGGINTRTFERWILGPTIKVTGAPPSRLPRRKPVPARPLHRRVEPQIGDVGTRRPLGTMLHQQRTTGAPTSQARPPPQGKGDDEASSPWGPTIKVSGPRPPRLLSRSHVPAGPLDRMVRPHLFMLLA